MRSSAIIRCAVLVLIALLAIDACWCCDETINVESSVRVLSADDGCTGQVDCHTCICSGLALVKTVATFVPALVSEALSVSSARALVNEAASIDVPPGQRG